MTYRTNIAASPSDNQQQATTELIRAQLNSALGLVDTMSSKSIVVPNGIKLTDRSVSLILRQRRKRAQYFGTDLFSDPAWDILLELYAAELGQRRVSVSAVCHGTCVPATTALRWLRTLMERQLIQRRQDPMDGRRVFVSLTASGLGAMNDYFANLGADVPLM